MAPAPERPRTQGKTITKRVLWGLYGVLVAISVIIVAVFLVGKALIKPPEIPEEPPAASQPQTPVTPAPGDTSQEEDPVPEVVRHRRSEVYNFVLLGKDVDSGNTDAIIVVSYDVPNKKVGMISIPRDTAVERDWRKNPKINGAFHGAGADVLMEEIEHTFGIPIDFYIHVDLKGFIALVDELGGVDVDIPVNMNYDDPTEGEELHIHFEKGFQHLNGQQTMEAVRYRHDNDPSINSTYTDVGRSAFQRQVLVALAKKVVSWNSVTKVTEFLDIFNTYVDTDLTMTEMLYFATQALQVDLSSGVTQGSLPGDGSGIYKGIPYCFVFKAEKILPILNEQVNPYDQPLTEEDLHLPVPEGYV